MGWKTLSGPIVGNLSISNQTDSDVRRVLDQASAAGVQWVVGKERRFAADFCLIPDHLDIWGQAAFYFSTNGTSRIVEYRHFADLLRQHQESGTPLRDLLLQHLFRKELPLASSSTYRFQLMRGTSLQERLCRLDGVSPHLQTSALFFNGEWEDSGEPAAFAVEAVHGWMTHLGSGQRVFAKDVAQRLLDPAAPINQGNTVTIGGDVGQSIAGDVTFSAPVSFGISKART